MTLHPGNEALVLYSLLNLYQLNTDKFLLKKGTVFDVRPCLQRRKIVMSVGRTVTRTAGGWKGYCLQYSKVGRAGGGAITHRGHHMSMQDPV